MTASVLVAYGTKRGSTAEVAEAVAGTMREQGLDVDVRPAAQVDAVEPYDAVVVGGALYTGRWHRDALRFVERHRDALATRPVCVFGMGPRTLAPDDVAASRAQLDAALANVPEVEPVAVAVFGGAVDPAKLRFPFSRMPASDAREWGAIRVWSEAISAYCRSATSPYGHTSHLTPRERTAPR